MALLQPLPVTALGLLAATACVVAGGPLFAAGRRALRLRRALGSLEERPLEPDASGWVLVRGVRRPVVGAVSMDGITVDLGDLDDVTYADEFVLIGEQMGARIDADEVAAQRRTINYEVTTALRERLPRVHLPEAAANAG